MNEVYDGGLDIALHLLVKRREFFEYSYLVPIVEVCENYIVIY